MPSDPILTSEEQQEISFARSIASIDGVPPSKEAERILGLYIRGEIDYETAQLEIRKLYQE